MAIKELCILGDERLRTKSKPVKKITKSIRKLVKDMVESMRANYGVGLAAPQIGENLRVVVIEMDAEHDPSGRDTLYVAINPEILKSEGEAVAEEGCLSIPGVYAPVKRASRLRVTYQNENGDRITKDVEGYLAVAFQHELDHLDGVLFIDRLSVPIGNVEKKVAEAMTEKKTRAKVPSELNSHRG